MKRREFITLGLLLLTTPIFAKSSISSWEIIKSTLEHLFPKYKQHYGAKELDIYNFLDLTVNSKYFSKDDFDFLISGTKELHRLDNNFLNLSIQNKEKILRNFENTKLGKNWLKVVMNYAIEGMLSDPIYGGNKNQLGWSALKHTAGFPRPRTKYAI